MNMMNHMQMPKGIGNPRQIIQGIMENSQMMQNPMIRNVMGMAQKGDILGVENFGRNIAKERGIDFDSEFEKFKRQFPMK